MLVHEGHVKWRGDGKRVFWLDDYRGADTVTVRVTTPDGHCEPFARRISCKRNRFRYSSGA